MKAGLRHILILTLLCSAKGLMSQCTNYNITVSFGIWPSEVSWQLVNSSSTIVASGFAGANQTVCLPDGCYTFLMFDSYGDGWNGAAFTITDPGLSVIATGTFTSGFSASQSVTLGSINCCPPGTTSFNFNVTAGGFSYEIYWYVKDSGGMTVATGGAPFNSTFCLAPGCYQFYLFDSFGDGWNGAVYTITEGGNTIATGTMIDGDSQIDFISVGGVSCIPTCAAGQVPYMISVSEGFFPNEVLWNLYDDNSNQIGYGGAPFAQYFCAAEGCYELEMIDAFGDGWNGSEFFIYDENGNQTQTGTLNSGSYGTTPIEIGNADCGIPDPITASDCITAVDICENFNFAIDPNGQGLINEIPPLGSIGNPDYWVDGTNSPWGTDNWGCLRANELNSTWMIVNIWQGGILNFTFGGMGTQAGFYDWIMYPYDSLDGCQDIYNNVLPPVRCNWNLSPTGGTGLQSIIPAGGSPGNFEPPLAVNTGDQYIICFSNYSSATTTVPLDFGGTAVVGCFPLMLPVELISFNAGSKGESVELNWTTMSEENNDYFEVQHQMTDGEWKTVGTVDGNGTSTSILHYSFLHHEPFNGGNYYRLKQVDFNGAYAHSEIAFAYIEGNEIVIYPNPNTGRFICKVPASQMKIYDALGREVEFMQTSNFEIALNNPAKGIYFLVNLLNDVRSRIIVE